MPPKRKTEDSTAKPAQGPPSESQQTEKHAEDSADAAEGSDSQKELEKTSTEGPAEDDAAAKARQRQERFKALQSRAVSISRTFLLVDKSFYYSWIPLYVRCLT